ncbi:MAG: superoxide dismutase [Myxococcaceae bacterium]|nr:superoxide dismutase [Myxococcaceae bacterium]
MEDNSRSGSTRRRFIGSALAASASLLVAKQALAQSAKPALADAGAAVTPAPSPSNPSLALPPLPYAQNALEPYISGTTLSFHYGKHHKGYFDKLNTLIESTPYKGKTLEDIVKAAAKNKKDQKIFNNAAQAWNHNFYWSSMKPKGGGAPTGDLKARIDKDFGSYDEFKAQFSSAAVDHFSNGWVWLVLDKGKLKIVDTHDADTPVVHGQKPLAVSDVWEHAYYLDYKNARKDYITAYVDHLLNWDFVAANLG